MRVALRSWEQPLVDGQQGNRYQQPEDWGKASPLKPPERSTALLTPCFQLWDSKQRLGHSGLLTDRNWDNTCVLVYTTKFVVICYRGNRKPISPHNLIPERSQSLFRLPFLRTWTTCKFPPTFQCSLGNLPKLLVKDCLCHNSLSFSSEINMRLSVRPFLSI